MEWNSLMVFLLDYNSKTIFSLTLGAGLLAYYLLEAVKRPQVACRDGLWRKFLETRLGILQERYWPTPWCYEARCQTIVASVLRSRMPDIPYNREVLILKDGGQVSLDWLEAGTDEGHPGRDSSQVQENQANSRVNEKERETENVKAKKKENENETENVKARKKENGTENVKARKNEEENGTENVKTKKNEEEQGTENDKAEMNEKTKIGSDIRPGKEESRSNYNHEGRRSGEDEESSQGSGKTIGNNNIVMVLPGLTGSSQSEYVKGLVLKLQQEGITCVVLNNRGIGGVRLMTTRTYCAANSDDLEEALDHLGHTHPNAAIFIIGISLGGIITGNYLVTRERKAASQLVAAAVVSAPWNMVEGLRGMERPGLNLLLNRYLVSCLCELADTMRYQLAGKKHKWDLDHVMESRTMREFDTRFTAHQFGFVDAEDYYRASSLHNRLHQISVPLLCLHAADDPFQPIPVLPMKAAERTSHVGMVVTAKGGHIGFMDGLIPSLVYYSDRLLAQLVVAVFSNLEEMADIRKEAEEYKAKLVADEVLKTSM